MKYTDSFFEYLFFSSALPSAYNNWSSWAWDWWISQQKNDVKIEQNFEESKTADHEQQVPEKHMTPKWSFFWKQKIIFNLMELEKT